MEDYKKINPWYKEPWVWFIIGILVFAILASLSLVWIAINNKADLVSDDYYNEGRNINIQVNKERKAQELRIKGDLFIREDMQGVMLILQSKNILKGNLKLILIHPKSQDDKEILLVQSKNNPNSYSAKFENTLPLAKHWYIRVEDMNSTWRIRGKWIINHGNVVKLEPVLERYSN